MSEEAEGARLILAGTSAEENDVYEPQQPIAVTYCLSEVSLRLAVAEESSFTSLTWITSRLPATRVKGRI
jgi:hypothetical protein